MLNPCKLPNVFNLHIFKLIQKHPRKVILRPRFLGLVELLQVNIKTSLIRLVALVVPFALPQKLEFNHPIHEEERPYLSNSKLLESSHEAIGFVSRSEAIVTSHTVLF